MKTLSLQKNKKTWKVKYDEKTQAVAVEGPGSEGEQLHHWLTKRKHVVVSEEGDLLAVIPAEKWTYMKQAIEKDLYNDFGMIAVWDSVQENDVEL